MRNHKIRIIYKSGQSIDIRCEQFSVKRNALGGLHTVEWTNAKPRPLFAGVDHIAAVYEL